MLSHDSDTGSDNDNNSGVRKVVLYCAFLCAEQIYSTPKESTLEMKTMGENPIKIIIIKFLDRGKEIKTPQCRKTKSIWSFD